MLLAFIALMLLRVVIGFHFYKEGTSKLRSGKFTAEYFLKEAKGPLAPHFQKLLRDYDGRERLCIEDASAESGEQPIDFNTDLSFALWEDFLDRASSYYGFGSAELESEVIARREELAQQIQTARQNRDTSVDTRRLEELRQQGEESIKRIRSQTTDAERILESHKQQLADWLAQNQTEIISFYSTSDRLNGFERDGENRQAVATYVDSLREQVDTIRNDRAKQLAEWTREVEAIWDSYETQIHALATDKQAERAPLSLHRPYDQPNSNLKLINQFIPWFDTIVGVLLILGLFTRLASLAGAGFLASVIAAQPPWVPGTTPTYYQAVELCALLVIFATCAGRMGGLDFFLTRKKRTNSLTQNLEP